MTKFSALFLILQKKKKKKNQSHKKVCKNYDYCDAKCPKRK